MKLKLRPRCFFDIDIGHSPAGRIIFELFDDICPKTVDNFIKLCTGECGNSETTGKKLHYLNSTFHRVIKGFMIQGGDFSNGDGSGGESIYGGRFNDENLDTPHDKPFLLSMANCGPNTNGSQFFITTKPASHLDGKHVVFGHVVSGENLIESIENLPVNSVNKPIVEATISNCGKLIAVRKKKSKKQKEKEVSVDSSSDKGKKKKKSKKKKHRNKRKMKILKDDEEQTIYPKCSVRPDEIPEVPKPFFLYRGNLREENTEKNENKETVDPSKYISKDLIGRSGRIIKGRGQLRYNSKSPRDRMDTPPHWKKDSYKPQDDTIDRYNTKTKSISPSPNNRDYQNNRQSRRENDSPRPNHRANDNNNNNNNNNNRNFQENEQLHRERKRKNDVWKDVSEKNDDKSKRHKKEELEDYGDVDKFEGINQKINHQKRSSSLEKSRKIDRERMNHKANKSKNSIQNLKQERVEGLESENIIYPYGDESDESLKHKRSDKIIVDNRLGQSKPKIHSDKDEEMKRKSGNYDNLEKLKIDGHVTRKRSTSESYKHKSTSPTDGKRHTQSPPAHLVAKWQNRREKIMIRRSSISRSNERNQSRSRYSPRRRSSRYSKSPRSDKNKHESKPREEHRVSNNNIRKISKDRSSSGTMDSSLSSAGSSVSNRPCRIDSELSDTEKTVNTQSWINDSTSNQQVENNKEKKIDMPSTSADKIKENELKTENLTEKETLMVLKPPEKPWLTNQWKTEDEEANKKVQKITNNSILAKLREDDQKKSQEKQEKPSATSESRQNLKKIQSPVSQSISKYRSPSGTKSSNNDRSSFSSSSSSRSDSRRRSRSHSRSRSYYKRKYRNSHYYRSSRRSTSRSLRRYRSRSRSYSKSSRRRYSSRSSSTSRSSRYIRSSRRNYRGLGFRRPSVSPRPRK